MTVAPGSTAISSRFAGLKQQGRCALMPFLTAGDPDLATTRAALLALQANGADLVELGIPYSDPLADGPVIQAAASRALAVGTTPASVLEMLAGLKGELTMPVVLFTYSNPLLNVGMESSAPMRLLLEQLAWWCLICRLRKPRSSPPLAAHGLDLVLLVAPTTPAERMGRIAASRGFTYMVSVTGVTGERAQMESRVAGLVGQLKAMGPTPVAVGFGISGPQQAIEVRSWGADGAIVGSALVKRMAQAKAEGGDPVATAGAFCAELRAALDS